MFRCSQLLFKSALRLMFLCVMKSSLASLYIFESLPLTSNALLLKLSFRGTILDIMTVPVFVLMAFATSIIDFAITSAFLTESN